MEIRGRIHLIGETTQVTATFKKREIVLLIDGQYPQYPLFEFGQDRCTLLDSFQVGQDVELSFSINGRASTNAQGQTKYFNSLNAYMIKAIGSGGATAAATAPPATQAPSEDPMMASWKAASLKYTDTQRASLGYTSEADWKKAIAANKTPESLASFMADCEAKLAADDDLPF